MKNKLTARDWRDIQDAVSNSLYLSGDRRIYLLDKIDSYTASQNKKDKGA